MGQPLSIENEDWTFLITSRTSSSRLWFINSPALEKGILGALARYQNIYHVKIFAFVLMGNHYHLLARFPLMNRADFMRDFNSAIARLVGRSNNIHGRRSVWARRYAWQALLTEEDIKNWFFYVGLNPVSSGIVSRVQSYQSYNSFFDAAHEVTRTYRWINWSAYLLKRRTDKNVRPENFFKEYSLCYEKLPGLMPLKAEEYKAVLFKELLERQNRIVEDRYKEGKGFLTRKKYAKQTIGAVPRNTKLSQRNSIRPLILTLSSIMKKYFLSIYFNILERYRESSISYRKGEFYIAFPYGTYPPRRMLVRE